MRDILFRGKRLDNGKWYYGSYLFLKDAPTYDWTGKKKAPYDDVYFIVDNQDVNYAVDSETVGQYTGQVDRNGQKIFEGDILRIGGNEKYCFSVSFLCGRWECANPLRMKYYGHALEYYDNSSEKYEVIGNIHDNPEMLETHCEFYPDCEHNEAVTRYAKDKTISNADAFYAAVYGVRAGGRTERDGNIQNGAEPPQQPPPSQADTDVPFRDGMRQNMKGDKDVCPD